MESLFSEWCQAYKREFLQVVRERVIVEAELLYYKQQGVDLGSLLVIPEETPDTGDAVQTALDNEATQLEACRKMHHILPFSGSIDHKTVKKAMMDSPFQAQVVVRLFCRRFARTMKPQCIAPLLVKLFIEDLCSRELYRILF
jgi:hypothetical protein